MGVPIKRATSPQIIEPSENNEIASPIIDRPAHLQLNRLYQPP